MIKDFEVLDETNSKGQHLIKLTSGEFSGIIYSYGAVSFEEGTDEAKMKFDYDVYTGVVADHKNFEQVIGNVLIDILTEQLAKNEIVYTGGIDENRTTDSE